MGQQLVHQLRSKGDMSFDEITCVVPWIEIATDMGQDLDGDQEGYMPRAWKSHCSWQLVPKNTSSSDPNSTIVNY